MKQKIALLAFGALVAASGYAQEPCCEGRAPLKTASDSLRALSRQVEDLRRQLSSMQNAPALMSGKPGHGGDKPCCGEGQPQPPMPCCGKDGGPKKKRLKAVSSDEDYNKFRFGGYGEMVASFKDYGYNRFSGTSYGNTKEHRATIAIPRFVFAFDYKFNSRWSLGSEIEFESGGVGIEQELEPTENLEYEYELEKGGEVALEQFHLTFKAFDWLNIRAGHMIVPLGLTNSHHEPINFFGTYRPEGETTIIPSTWHETGFAFFGSVGKGYANFDYEIMAVAGLNADGFGRDNWVGSGKQGIFEADNFSSPGYAGRINYNGVPGLRVGFSAYYCADVTRNGDKPYKYSTVGNSSLRIFSGDAQYKNRYVTARANVIWGQLENANKISAVNTSSRFNSYASGKFRSTAKNALCYGVEAGLNIGAFFRSPKAPAIYPFGRYEYYNPQEKGENGVTMDKRLKVAKWTGGINWYALPNLVVKADYTTRKIGTNRIFGHSPMNRENEFSIGIAYVGWFTKR